ncbi:hypothetical protein J6590_100546, partial [Homalodisca vitripennis]
GIDIIKHCCGNREECDINDNMDNSVLQNFYIPIATPKSIVKIIKGINADKSPGIDR